ncbi:piwi-like protein 2 [Agrilus planipennis]|uniref:Piwi-like protein 2 n=1 Tax=Agrilus planipennis TaxID=224129 RepID=A0A7F5REZ5_AGRPL|nr:piwi-like protein 2 [Agrilus planipennis]
MGTVCEVNSSIVFLLSVTIDKVMKWYINVNNPESQELRDDRNSSIYSFNVAVGSADIQAPAFIRPTSRDDRYAAIKRKCCMSTPAAIQVINSRTPSNPQKVRSITQKNCITNKLQIGGTPWMVRLPVKTWMVIGIDVYHSQGNQSVCGFVGSLNENFMRWFSITIFQEREFGNQLKVAFAKLLERFHEINGTFPQKIIIFRDGVGDGQLAHCHDYEVVCYPGRGWNWCPFRTRYRKFDMLFHFIGFGQAIIWFCGYIGDLWAAWCPLQVFSPVCVNKVLSAPRVFGFNNDTTTGMPVFFVFSAVRVRPFIGYALIWINDGEFSLQVHEIWMLCGVS